jgi:hypothetical protein
MDKEYTATRALLGKAEVKTAPVGLVPAVMQRIHAIEENRVARRILWALVLRGACIGVCVCLLGVALASGLGRFGEIDGLKVAEGVVVLCLLAAGIKVFRILVL